MMLLQKLRFRSRGNEARQGEPRLKNRYSVALSFPLAVSLTAGGRICRGRPANISAAGIGLVVEEKPGAEAGAPAEIMFELDGFKMKRNAIVRYVRFAEEGFHCGLTLDLEAPEIRMAYEQMLVPISIGDTLALVPEDPAGTSNPEFEQQTFLGESLSRLRVWSRRTADALPDRFEFQVEKYVVRGRASDRSLGIFLLVDDDRPDRAKETSLLQAGDPFEVEIRQLFRWSALNMQENIPDRLRGFLRSFLR